MKGQLTASLVVGERVLLDLVGIVEEGFVSFSKIEGESADVAEEGAGLSEFYQNFYEELEYATDYVREPGEELSQELKIKPYGG